MSSKRTLLYIPLVIASVIVGLAYFHGTSSKYYNSKIQPYTETVMRPGMAVSVTNRHGSMQIEAVTETIRRMTWEGGTREVQLMVRYERWYGSLGLYSPGDRSFPDHSGIRRAVVEEGQMHFVNEMDFHEWIDTPYRQQVIDLKYRNDGLVVGWMKVPQRKQITVEVWQVLINGNKPTRLEGATDELISLRLRSTER
jgi:hypothetical protein